MAGESKHERDKDGRQPYTVDEPLHLYRPTPRWESPGELAAAQFGSPGDWEYLLTRLFQTSCDGIVLHEFPSPPETGCCIDVKDRLSRMLGYTRDELLRLTPSDFFDAEAKTAFSRRLQELRRSGGLLVEALLIRKDGQRLPVEISVSTLQLRERCLALAIVRDISERGRMAELMRQEREHLAEEVQIRTEELREMVDRLQQEVHRRLVAEVRLRKHSRMLEAFFEDTITPLAVLDRHFNFVRVNEAYARAAGRSPADFVGKNHFALYPHEENQAIFEETVCSRRPYQAAGELFTYPDQPQRGVTYWDWRLTPLCDDCGQIEFLVLSLEDVTERQQATRELECRARQLQKITRELCEAEDRERKRLAEILHDDLQQTLAAAKFHLGLLGVSGRTEAESAEIVGQVKQMLQDAIDKSRNLSHELGPAVLSQGSLDDTFAWLAGQMQSKHGLVVHVQTRGRVDPPSEPVRAFLYRAAREILFNVVKHAEVSEAQLRLRRVRNHLRLTISDRGQGFDLHLLVGDAGFGLRSVQERAALLGGRMKIKSARGKGSTFLIAVPDAILPLNPA